ncbi:MAG: patatin-like phospholipase family protein [Gammaproteobacteria bacterium]|nr:patatin-like phospholipase family protein [Gammaproteobacteria bacterium]
MPNSEPPVRNHHINLYLWPTLLLIATLLSACATQPATPPIALETNEPEVIETPAPIEVTPPTPSKVPIKPKIALVLGGGAARGFAHIGVIKVLEGQGIIPDMVVGTSAGSVVGALYAGGYSGFDLQKIAFEMEQSSVSDFSMPNRGFIKGELLQSFINKSLHNRPMEKLAKPFAAVATDLHSGDMIVFRRGNTGMAVRASSSVPGIFQPVVIGDHEYVDGGLVSPIPIRVARSMGADIVIAVDISKRPRTVNVEGTIDVLLQTFSIMGQTISNFERAEADVVIRPEADMIGASDFDSKHLTILEGEKATQAAMPLIREKLQAWHK